MPSRLGSSSLKHPGNTSVSAPVLKDQVIYLLNFGFCIYIISYSVWIIYTAEEFRRKNKQDFFIYTVHVSNNQVIMLLFFFTYFLCAFSLFNKTWHLIVIVSLRGQFE